VTDDEIKAALAAEDAAFKMVVDEHRDLDRKLKNLTARVHLTPEEEFEKKSMQKRKLSLKDKIAEGVRVYREARAAR
jgi:hypothetical protein